MLSINHIETDKSMPGRPQRLPRKNRNLGSIPANIQNIQVSPKRPVKKINTIFRRIRPKNLCSTFEKVYESGFRSPIRSENIQEKTSHENQRKTKRTSDIDLSHVGNTRQKLDF